MAVELSSNCECSNCLEGSQNDSDRNSSSRKRGDDALHSKPSKRSVLSPIMQRFLSQCYSNRLENTNKEDSMFLPSEEESSMGFSQKQNLSQTSKDTSLKIKPLRELTIQELLRKFGNTGKFQHHSMSLGHFRDHVVIKFRRALYYSGIWVKHVQGSTLEKHFSAKYFKRNPSSLHRLIPWLKRELIAVYGDYGYTVKNILAAILHHMTEFNLDSESFIHLLEPYLLQHTRHFLHEFISFVHSSYNMETYDRSAIYQCPVSIWLKNKNSVSAPVLPLPENLSLMISQQGPKQPKKSQVQWNKTEKRTHSGLKQFLNGNSSPSNPQISTTYQNTANKFHVWTNDDGGLDDFKDVVCTTNSLFDWDNPRENNSDTGCYKNNHQENMTEGTKLLPGHVQEPQKSATSPHIYRVSVYSNQAPPRKCNLQETNILSPAQEIHQKKAEKKKLEEFSPKGFQRLRRARTMINSKSIENENDHSCNVISENIPSPTRNDKMLSSFREKKIKYSQSSQCIEGGSHHGRRTQSQSGFRTPRSKSWCVRSRKRSTSRDKSNLLLRGSQRSQYFTQNLHRGPSKRRVHGCESANRMISLTSIHSICLAAGKSHNCASTGEADSQTGRQCDSLSHLQTENYRCPSMQDMKGKNLIARDRRIRIHELKKPKCQYLGTQTTAEFNDESGDLEVKGEMDCHSECVPSCRR